MAEQIRVIIASNADGSNERVYFTQDLDSPAEEFFYMGDGLEINSDDVIDDNLPSTFLREYELVRD
ncbi:MAG TPA: hypothetical protein ENH82_19415 [bacterium]|nr:hypothetical protein [bacterium]